MTTFEDTTGSPLAQIINSNTFGIYTLQTAGRWYRLMERTPADGYKTYVDTGIGFPGKMAAMSWLIEWQHQMLGHFLNKTGHPSIPVVQLNNRIKTQAEALESALRQTAEFSTGENNDG